MPCNPQARDCAMYDWQTTNVCRNHAQSLGWNKASVDSPGASRDDRYCFGTCNHAPPCFPSHDKPNADACSCTVLLSSVEDTTCHDGHRDSGHATGVRGMQLCTRTSLSRGFTEYGGLLAVTEWLKVRQSKLSITGFWTFLLLPLPRLAL